jgi:RNA polymerase sigma-70 factor (ECF subfamily)
MPPARANEDWIRTLSGAGERQDEAINDLRQYLLKTSLYTLYRYQRDIQAVSPSERLALAEDCAQEALITVLDHLGEFRGESKFTTWAFKFAVNISLSCARREGWKQMSLESSPDGKESYHWLVSNNHRSPPDGELKSMQAEVAALLDEAIQHHLTDRQRLVFRLIVFEQVPMDAVVQRLGTNRNAVYKLLHDARKKLKQALQSQDYKLEEIVHLFGK